MNLRRRCVGALAAVTTLVVPLTAPAGTEPAPDRSAAVAEAEAGPSNSHQNDARRTSSGAMVERPPWTNTACPEMTDSITRLYRAYFNRQPEQGGFEFWLDQYSQGGWNLDRMSRHFAVSDEFVDTYGSLSDREFVELIYANIHGREPDPTGLAFWTDELESGRMSRGRVMIFFSESEEYVTATQTVIPLAGYLGWYPEGTTWSCGVGPAAVQMNPGTSHVDIFLDNLSRTEQPYTITSYDPNFADPILEEAQTIPVGYFHYYLNAELNPAYGYLEFDMSDEVWWIVVDSPLPMVAARPGWF